jgi:hypothetical protein
MDDDTTAIRGILLGVSTGATLWALIIVVAFR